MSVIDWFLKDAMLARQLQEQQQSGAEFPNRLREQDTIDALRRMSMQQSQESFPLQQEGLRFQLERAKEGVPAADFSRDVSAFGPYAGGDKFVSDQPELAMQLWGNQPTAMSGGEEGPPDLRGAARNAGQHLYQGGAETATKAAQLENAWPFTKEALDIQGKWGLRQHQASQGNQMQVLAEKQKREAAGAAAAMINQSPANNAFQAFQEAVVQVKDQAGAATLMKQMTAISNQLEQVGKNALSTGVAMGGDPMQLRMLIEQQINSMRQQLSKQYEQLLSKFYTNAPPSFGSRASGVVNSMVPGFRAPENTEGYLP